MENQLTTEGIIFMASAWIAIGGLAIFSMWKVFTIKEVNKD